MKQTDAPAKMVVELEKQGKHEAPVVRWEWGATAPTDTASGRASEGGNRSLMSGAKRSL